MHKPESDDIMTSNARLKRQTGTDGVVLELDLKGDGFYDAFYTLDTVVGTPPTTYPLLLDTGSSDLWIATPGLTSPSYSPSGSSTSTPLPLSNDAPFTASYLLGGLSGHLYSDTLSIGPYTLPHQALCAADEVQNESLNLGFSGILGFGLGGISAIENAVRTTGNTALADGLGAPIVLNLFNPNVQGGTPTQQWFALVLDRPGFTQDQADPSSNNASATPSIPAWSHVWPARLAIGAHVDEVVHAFAVAAGNTASPSSTTALDAALQTVPLVTTPGAGTSSDAYTHWKTRLSGITIYMDDGSPRDVHLSRGVDGGAFPVAVLDSGGPNVLASRAVADAVYSIWGVNMSEDGNYYVPCNKPLNVTITLGTSSPIPIHPLDMSTYVHNDRVTYPTNCLGTIQVSTMLGTSQSPADVALGISFLRNVYTIHQMAAPTSPGTVDTGAATPRIAIAALTNPTLALTEFQNVRGLNLTPNGRGRETPAMTGTSAESLSTVTKIMLGLGLFLGAVIVIFAARWFVLRRRFERMRREGKLSTDGHGISRSGSLWTRDGVAGVVDVIRRKTTLRTKKRREQKQGLGGWREVSEVGHEEGLSGAVATKSAIGHGGGGDSSGRSEHESAVRYAAAPTIERDRRPEERQGTGPFAGFSLWTFVGAKRLLGPKPAKGRYARTANPGLPGELEMEGGLVPPVPPIPEGLLTEDQLRAQRFAAHQRRTKQEKESSVWSDSTWIDRGDGTLVPAGMAGTAGAGGSQQHGTDEFGGRRTYAYPGTPNETVVGTPGGKRNEYGFPKGQGDSDDESTEKESTLHGSPFVGKSSSREALPLLPLADPSVPIHQRTGSGGQPRHGPFPPLELHHPPRMDSSGIITSSPYPMTPAAGTSTPPATDSFNPYSIPTTIPASPQPQPTLVHPARERITLAMEPSLSPLTEVNSSEFPSTNRASISTLLSKGAGGAANVANRISQEAGVERQNSISTLMSAESEVLVPLPISFMNLPHSESPPRVDRELLRGFDFSQPTSPPRPSQTLPVQRTAPFAHPLATSHTLPPQLPTSDNRHPPFVPAASGPAPLPTRVNNPPPPTRTNNPFDLLALDDFAIGPASKDSRFPSLGPAAKDSRFPTFASASRPVMTATTSADSFRPTSVAVPDEAARPRLRMRATDLEPRPQSEAIGFGSGPVGPLKVHEHPWMKPRSQSGGNTSLPPMNRPIVAAAPVPIPAAPAEPTMHDFAPPHEHRPGRPEQRTLPVMGNPQRSPPLHKTSEPASSSMGPRSRGPRPMVAGPRSSRSTGSTGSAQSQHSPPTLGSRQGTNYDSPLPLGSSPSGTSPGATSSNSSLPPGTRAPSDSFLHHHLPSIPGSSTASTSPSTNLPTIPSAFSHPTQSRTTPVTTPSSRYEASATRGLPSRSVTTESDPEAAYGGMAAESDAASQAGWREEAAKTAGFAGVGARSRFTGVMDPSPFEDRP